MPVGNSNLPVRGPARSTVRKNMASQFKIGNVSVGKDSPTFIIAEMSGNHGGSLEGALEVVRAAKKTGADAVKLQTYTPDTITLNSDKPDFLIPSTNPWQSHNNLYSLYQKAYTPWEWHAPLFAEAKKLGIEIFSSPFDESAVELLESLGAPAYKIASPEITHIPLLERVARTGKPVIVSTGTAELPDIELAVRTIRACGNDQIVLLKCTASYPAPPESIHLRTIPDMARQFSCVTGLSDHTLGIGVPVASVALGAAMIEKHFILSKDVDSVDGFFSLDLAEFTLLVQEVRKVEKALGNPSYALDSEGKKNAWGRRSIYVRADVKRGELISEKNIQVVRPSFGLHPKHWKEVLGKKAKRDLFLGDRLSLDDLE